MSGCEVSIVGNINEKGQHEEGKDEDDTPIPASMRPVVLRGAIHSMNSSLALTT